MNFTRTLHLVFFKARGKKHLAINTGYFFVASVVGALIQLLMNPFLALKMEHYDYALVGYFASFSSLLSPLIFFSLASYYARNYFLLGEEQRESLRNTMTLMSLSLSLILSIVSLVFLYAYFRISAVSFPYFPYALISVSGIFFNSVYNMMVVDLRMSRKAKKFLFIHVSHAACSAILAIIMVIIMGLGGTGRMLATSFTALVFFIYSTSNMISKWEFKWVYASGALKFCWPLAAAAMLGYFSLGFDRAMLEKIQDIRSLGLYNIGMQISGYAALFTSALSQTFQPDIYKSIADRNVGKTALVVLAILGLGIIPIGLFILFATPLLHLLTFGRFTAAAGFARILSLRNLTTSLYHSVCGVLEGYGLTKTVLFTRAIGSIAVVAMFAFLIKRYGFLGAAWGQVFSSIMMTLVILIYMAIAHKKSIVKNMRVLSKRLGL